MKSAWREGGLERLDQLTGQPMRRDSPVVYQRLVKDRNYAWLPELTRMFQSPEVELVMVGAMHLAGPDGLIGYFQRQGYRVEPLR